MQLIRSNFVDLNIEPFLLYCKCNGDRAFRRFSSLLDSSLMTKFIHLKLQFQCWHTTDVEHYMWNSSLRDSSSIKCVQTQKEKEGERGGVGKGEGARTNPTHTNPNFSSTRKDSSSTWIFSSTSYRHNFELKTQRLEFFH